MSLKNTSILVIDDDPDVLIAVRLLLKTEVKKVVTEKNPENLPALLRENSFDLVLLDMNFKSSINTGNEGIYWLKRIRELNNAISVIMITAYGDIDLAVRSLKEGASDFILKPWHNEKLLANLEDIIKKTKRAINGTASKEAAEALIGTELLAESEAMKNIFYKIEKIAPTDANILILGENGTGKDLTAKAIHQKSLRAKQPYIKVDVGALTETLFESELFGHKKGAFTDAREDRIGRIEAANGGTLFLDEIGNISLQQQAKLLSVLQNRQVIRLGTNQPIPVDIRLICATNMPLQELANENRFRKDLIYRINTVEITLPPLRYRKEDIILLAKHFAKQYAAKYRKPAIEFERSALEKLMKYPFPGNVRELQYTMERAIIMSESEVLTERDLLFSPIENSVSQTTEQDDYKLSTIEKNTILHVIEKHNGNITKAAKELGLTRQLYTGGLVSMIYNRPGLRLAIRIVLLSIVLFAACYLLIKNQILFGGIVLIAAVYVAYSLYEFLKKAQAEVMQFVEGVHYRDFSRHFDVKHAPAEVQSLRQGFNDINSAFKVISLERETQYQYLQKILELVDTGILSYEVETGNVVWMNESLKKLLKIPYLKTIQSLDKRDSTLCTQVVDLKPGENTVVDIHIDRNLLKILISATAFQTNNKRYKLIAFQNVNEALDETESKAWQKLLRVMTHEIMNSVAPISSLADTLKNRLQHSSELVDDETGTLEDLSLGMETIKRRSEGLLKFAQTYRNLNMISAPNLQKFYVKDLFKTQQRLMMPTLQQKNIELDIILKDNELQVEADINLIEQVLINLLLNAMEAVKETPHPKIILTASKGENGRIAIKIVDNGSGIEDEVLDKIFIPFFSTKKSGSGIGLSLCKQIMMLHKGNIHVQSVMNEGTAFILQF